MPRVFKINVNGTDYDVTVQELSDVSTQLMPQYRASAPTTPSAAPAIVPAVPAPVSRPAAGSGDQCAQMGGVVASVLVKTGQAVNEGDTIAELEAMKMKIPVVATESGAVTSIQVAEGDPVEIGQVLITIG